MNSTWGDEFEKQMSKVEKIPGITFGDANIRYTGMHTAVCLLMAAPIVALTSWLKIRKQRES